MQAPDQSRSSIGNDMLEVARALFANMNIGFILHRLENTNDVASLRFVYANEAASKYTGTDLSKLFGKPLSAAFPELVKTDVPDIFAEVVRTGEAHNIGAMEYSDENVKKAYFSVKAFPLADQHVGVVFENITAHKELEALVKKYTGQIRDKNRELENLLSQMYNDVSVPLRKMHSEAAALLSNAGEKLVGKDREAVQGLADQAQRLAERTDELLRTARGGE